MSSVDEDTKSIAKDERGAEPHSKTRCKPKRSKLSKIKVEQDSDTRVNSNGICPRCNTISIEVLLDPSLDIPEAGVRIIALGKPSTKAFQEGCFLCELFLSVATTYKRRYDLELRLFDRIPKQHHGDGVHVSTLGDRFLAVVRQNERLIYDFRIAHEIGSNGILVASPSGTSLPQVRVVNPVGINYDMVKCWLDECMGKHASICDPIHTRAPDLQLHVIDCLDDTIKLLPQHQEYVALSYVWGRKSGSTRFDTSVDDGIGQSILAYDIPFTIRDAMHVVNNIGRRYLWVDRYCIPHTDSTRRAEAILNMNQIYAGAVMTIVALYGDNADSGLPGVSTVRRQGNQQIPIHGGHLTSTFPPLTSVIRKSTWSTRGWTFQEARLSRRCLFVSQHQAYYSCQVRTSSESIPGPVSFPAARQLNPKGLDPSMFAPDSNLMFSGIFLDRLSYSQRTLTYQKDALDAFRGILKSHPFVTFWGVPVAHREYKIDPVVCFTMGLLWARASLATFEAHMPNTYTGSYERRPGFPTWSWASIVGEVFQFGTNEICTYRKFFRNEVEHESEQLPASFEVRLKSSGIDLRSAVNFATTDMLPEISPSILIRGDLIRVKRERNLSTKPGKLGHIRYRFCGEDDEITTDVYMLPRIDLDEYDVDSSEPQDALVLIDWRDGGRKAQRRFILMLLKWVSEGVAERAGLLGRYYEKWNLAFLERLWRRRVDFELR